MIAAPTPSSLHNRAPSGAVKEWPDRAERSEAAQQHLDGDPKACVPTLQQGAA
jgi:hypothetical protein